MSGSKRKRLPQQRSCSPPRSVRLVGEEPHSQRVPTPPVQAGTFATSTDAVGEQGIAALSAVSGLEDNNHHRPQSPPTPHPRRLRKYKYPEGLTRTGKLHPKIRQFQTPRPAPPPTDTTATSIGSVADQLQPILQPIPPASTVNGAQRTDNNRPQTPAPAPAPNVPVPHRRSNGTALDPNSVGINFRDSTGLWDCNLWFPGVRVPNRRKIGLQVFLGSFLTKQEAQDVHDRAALKLFETNGLAPGLNFPAFRQAKFMEECRDWDIRDLVWLFRRTSARFTSGKSSMKGVTLRTDSKGTLFEAKIAYTYPQGVGKVFYDLGKFVSEEDAGRAYDRALMFLHHKATEEQKLVHVKTNFRPGGYSESEILRAGEINNITDPYRS